MKKKRILTTQEKHEAALKMAKRYKGKKPLNQDIAGLYTNDYGKLYPEERPSGTKTKNVHSIVQGSHKAVVFVNHTDYTKEMCYYELQDEGMVFDYNNTQYLIENYHPIADEYAIVKKVS